MPGVGTREGPITHQINIELAVKILAVSLRLETAATINLECDSAVVIVDNARYSDSR